MNKQDLDFQAAADMIRQASKVFLVSHEFTDGDELGAMLATKHALDHLAIESCLVVKGEIQDNLLFLPGVSEVKERVPEQIPELVIFFGCSEPARTGFRELEKIQNKTLNIDHHLDNKVFGDVNLVDGQAAATCEIVYHLLKAMRVKITKPMAVNLLTGIFNDTGGFQHANTSSEVLEIAAELIRKGARIDRISSYYFGKNDLPKLKAWAKALENAQIDPEQQMVYSLVTEEELAEIGAKPEDLEGVVSILNTIPETKFSMLLKQRGNEIKGSLRSEHYKGIDVSQIAKVFGGGGHKLAAGFKWKGRIEKTKEGWKIT